ncbi:TetR/AcrR family transcriptional regulator [Lentzea sp. DG1S-22]|uniref:TetR/AcrR family transcriptional regulator n=1 Tax=unclassified Lentzea TaxID=2643253 RepID=UPI001F20A151|nr:MULTISPECIES: TetR/AcrR family transcriptional regulator [unclassified Lentzea]MCG8927029.1 TetR/AcrR family transcriptional regulator [Lentzea sp. CC55]WVH81884.1 TetR/AcrR family transcriptional regulator [Lentzea sp. DG1S-22]
MSTRRAELLELAAKMFADRGYGQTTVRDIADAAGILSGSLYHHFDSKESMVDEILRTFLDGLFTRYREIVEAGAGPKKTLKALVVASFEAIDTRHAAVAIYQNEAKHLAPLERFSYIEDRSAEFRKLWTVLLEEGISAGVFRADLDVDVAYRFIRDTVWVAVRWYRPDGDLSAETVADQYLAILLDGIATGRRTNSKT